MSGVKLQCNLINNQQKFKKQDKYHDRNSSDEIFRKSKFTNVSGD